MRSALKTDLSSRTPSRVGQVSHAPAFGGSSQPFSSGQPSAMSESSLGNTGRLCKIQNLSLLRLH
jgi:hypothetical protein